MMGGFLHISSKNTKIIITVCAILLAVFVPVYAWYAMINRLTATDDLQVDMPPTIYIKDDGLQEITSFNLDGLTIGEEYNEVFCVSPAVIGSVNSFFLGVIYTENLGMNINLYPVYSVTDTQPALGTLYEKRDIANQSYYFEYRQEKIEDSGNIADIYEYDETFGNWENHTKPGPGNLNNGVYRAYKYNEFATSSPETADLIDELNDTCRYRFFILSVTWRDDIDYKGEANAKEADIVYIVAKGTMKKTQ